MSNILLFIPVYNCEKQITRVLEQITPDVAKHLRKVLVINNHSTDNSQAVAGEAIQKLPSLEAEVLLNDANYGYGGTLKVAFNYALEHNFDYAIILHGDDQGHISNLMPYLESGEFKSYDCLLGSRFKPDSSLEGYSRFRIFGNFVFNIIFSIFLGRIVYDLGAGLNLYRVSIFRDKYYEKFPDDLTFDYCGLMSHIHYKRKIEYFPISWTEDDQVSNVKMVSQSINSMKLLMRYFFTRESFFHSELRKNPIDSYTYKIIHKNY